jgi:hypothetical protein
LSCLALPHYLLTLILTLPYLTFLQEEATVYETLGNVIKLAVAHRMIGEVYTSMGQYDKALKHQRKHLGMTFDF